MIEINQRGDTDWSVYTDGQYKGQVIQIGDKFVCTYSARRYETRDEAIQFLLALDLPGVWRKQ